jgi:hypothetical protein
LERFPYDHRAESDAYAVIFEDGSHVEITAGGLTDGDKAFDGAVLVMRGLSEAIGQFIFEFSRAAGCVIFPVMEESCVLIPRDDLAAHLPPDLGDEYSRIPVTSGAEVLAALNGGFEAWQAYRDRVIRGSRDTAGE